jgi:hypothetical protein
MQTFLTHTSFKLTAQSLDNKRLGKQRVECKQILQTNQKISLYKTKFTPLSSPLNLAWKNHPAARMWRGCDNMLALYGAAMCKEWISRGFSDSLLSYFTDIAVLSGPLCYPTWISNVKQFDAIIFSHRSSLRFKDDAHYGPQFPEVPVKYGYYWPE